jgi:hypothetical protein
VLLPSCSFSGSARVEGDDDEDGAEDLEQEFNMERDRHSVVSHRGNAFDTTPRAARSIANRSVLHTFSFFISNER